MKAQVCPYCQQTESVIKSGRNSTGSQRYECRQCQRYFTPQPKPMGYEADLKQRALQLYLEGMSLRAIGRLLHVHHQSVANWIKAAALHLPSQVTETTATETIEVDELVTFVGKKKHVYLVVAVARESGLIVGQTVVPHRTWDAMQALVDQLPAAHHYCTDAFNLYAELL